MSVKRSMPPFITGLAISLALHASAIPLVAVWAQGSSHGRDAKTNDPSPDSKPVQPERAQKLERSLDQPDRKLDPATPLPRLSLDLSQPLPELQRELPKPEPERKKPEPKEPPEPPLGKADGTGDLRVAWISHEDFQELIAASGTVNQPALQTNIDPVAGAPLRVQAADENDRPRMLLAQATPGQTGSSGGASSPGSSSPSSLSNSGARATPSQTRTNAVQLAANDAAPPLEVPQPKPIQVPDVSVPKPIEVPKRIEPKLDEPKPVPPPKLDPAPEIKPTAVPEPAKIAVPDPAPAKEITVPAPPTPKPLPQGRDRSTIPVPEVIRTPASSSSSSNVVPRSSSSPVTETSTTSATPSPTPLRAADEAPILEPAPQPAPAAPAPPPAPGEPAESRRRSEPTRIALNPTAPTPPRDEGVKDDKPSPEKPVADRASKTPAPAPEKMPRPTPSLENLQLARAELPTTEIDTSLRIKPLSEADAPTPTPNPAHAAPANGAGQTSPQNSSRPGANASTPKPSIPAQPALVTGTLLPTAAARSDRQSMPVMLNDTPLDIPARNGTVQVADGIEMKTFLPQISVVTANSSLPNNPTAKLTFAPDGRVIEVKLTKSTGYADWDGPVIASFYRWRASGKRLEELGRSFEITVNLLLVK